MIPRLSSSSPRISLMCSFVFVSWRKCLSELSLPTPFSAGSYQSVWMLGFLFSYQDLSQVLLALLRALVILWHRKLCLVPSENPPVLWLSCHTTCLCPEADVLSNAKWLDVSLKEKLFNCSVDADKCDAYKRNWDFAHSNLRSALMPTGINKCLHYRLHSQ